MAGGSPGSLRVPPVSFITWNEIHGFQLRVRVLLDSHLCPALQLLSDCEPLGMDPMDPPHMQPLAGASSPSLLF